MLNEGDEAVKVCLHADGGDADAERDEAEANEDDGEDEPRLCPRAGCDVPKADRERRYLHRRRRRRRLQAKGPEGTTVK